MDLEDALAELLPQGQTGDRQADLIAAATEAWRRRHVNTDAGAAVIATLLEAGVTYRALQELTATADLEGIPPSTAHRWARPPEEDQGPESSDT